MAQSSEVLSFDLELVGISQLDSSYTTRFDLSGIVKVEDSFYVVADKSWNNYVYRIEFSSRNWKLVDSTAFNLTQGDWEGIDFCPGQQFYLADESNNRAYILNEKGHAIKIYDYLQDQWPNSWQENAGFESLAIDCENQILYLAKERGPRFIFELPLNGGQISETFNFTEEYSNDFADMKFEKGHLYMLERNGNYVTKLDPKTKMVVARASYRPIGIEGPERLYEPSKYGMAEALLITDTEIWVGLDNNGLEASNYAQERFGLKGRNPAIIKFKRPPGF
ncbi:MAG: SdiA-regulated domain-containing protein [Cyclobacteriaceae bacterium]